MRKITFLFLSIVLYVRVVHAGGILTNTNQSAHFVRMLSRNASTDLDAVYYNPAGLTQFSDGFYLGLNNQTIWQNRTITSEFPTLNNSEYKGKIFAPVFPDVYAVYKKDRWTFSVGFGPNGGGGSAKFEKGIPSFEKQISTLPTSLSASKIPTTAYSVDSRFVGSSTFYGSQFNISYIITDHVSVSAGVRVINVVNKYNGYLKNIMINPNYPAFNVKYDGQMVLASEFFADGNTFLNGLATNSVAVATGLSNAISAGTSAGTPIAALSEAQQTAIAQLLGAAGISSDGMNIGTAATYLNAVAVGFSANADKMEENSVATADKKVETKQTGLGFTPIIGLDLHFDKLNLAFKYEHKTNITLTNSTEEDDLGLFPDGEKQANDIPAIVAAGVDYQLTDRLKLSGSATLFLDKNVNWGKNIYGEDETIDKNYLELSVGAEYKLTDRLTISAGYMNSNSGASAQFQSDFNYCNDAYITAFGFQWKMNDRLAFDAGIMRCIYKDSTKTFVDASVGTYTETYGKDTFGFGVGIGYKIF
jgi:long-chain fatty acid transport protein